MNVPAGATAGPTPGDAPARVGADAEPVADRPMVEALWQDVLYAVRSLRSTPGFTVIALLCLAIGIGANTTMFGVADRLFLRAPPGVRDAGRIVRLYLDRPGGRIRTPGGGPASFPDYEDLRTDTSAFSSVAGFGPGRYTYGTGPNARQLEAENVTGRYFDVLGTRPAIGRFFKPDEDSVVASHPVVVISDGLWQREFGGDPKVLGRVITLDGRPFTPVRHQLPCGTKDVSKAVQKGTILDAGCALGRQIAAIAESMTPSKSMGAKPSTMRRFVEYFSVNSVRGTRGVV